VEAGGAVMRGPARFIALCVVLLACNSETRRLQEQLTVLDQKRVSLSQRLEQRRSTMRDTTHRLEALHSDLTTYNTETLSFIAAHRISAECIRASRSTWGENNAFSHDVSTATRFGTVLCSVALLNAQFAQEVARVAERLGEADAHVRDLKQQIAAAESALTTDRAEVEKSEAAVGEIAAEIADVQRQMER
jgi:predicted  nucleic acid-binding Zn-ribbon protein